MLTLTNIQYFRTAVTMGSVLGASERLHVSPSAVSRAIRCLEDHFGIPLLKHKKKQFVVTDEGFQLFALSETLTSDVERLEESMQFIRNGLAGTVRFASQQSVASHMLPGYLAHLAKSEPRITPYLRVGTTAMVRQWLENREVAFALSMDHYEMAGFSDTKVYSGKFAFVATRAVARRAERRFLLTEPTPEVRRFEIAWEKLHHEKPQVSHVVDSWGVLKRLAAEGLGIALIPDYLTRFDPDPRLVEVDLDLPPMKYGLNVYHDGRQGRLSHIADTSLRILLKYVAKRQQEWL